MRREDLDRALGATPRSFAQRMERTLLSLKEEKEMKRIALRTIILAAVITVLLGTTALALVSQGLEWYYSNRFTAYQEHEPEKYSAILDHLETAVPQTPVEDPDIRIAVTETSWAKEQRVLVVSLMAYPADPAAAELHPLWDLDADGAYVGKGNLDLYPKDEETREEHWLWTSAGFGPVEEMVAPGKQLLLLDASRVMLGDTELLGDMSSMDAYVTEDGGVHTVIELRLGDLLDPALEQDKDGVLTLSVPYTVTHYTENDELLFGGGRSGQVQFEVQFR